MNRKNNTLIALLVVIVILLIGGYVVLVQKENEPMVGPDNGNGTSVEIPSTTPSSSEEIVNNGSWEKYTSPDLGISFEYPASLSLFQERKDTDRGEGNFVILKRENEQRRFLGTVLVSSPDYIREIDGFPSYMSGDYFLDQSESEIEKIIRQRIHAVTAITKMPNNFYAITQEYVFGDNPVKGTFYFTQRKNSELLNVSIYQVDGVISKQEDLENFLESFKF